MGVIEEKFKWDGRLPRPSNMGFSYEDANLLSECGSGGGATTVIAPSNSKHTDRAGCVLPGANDQTMLNAAIAASKGRIVILDGDVHLSGDVGKKADTIIEGSGYATNLIGDSPCQWLCGDVSNFAIRNLRISGDCCLRPFYTATAKNILFENLFIDNTTQQAAFALHATNATVTDMTFRNCYAYQPDGFGFLITGITAPTFKNLHFENCYAYECGKAATRYNEWVTGFDLGEAVGGITLNDLFVTGCRAYRNYESGFHIEDNITVRNAHFDKCVSFDNGIDKASTTFGAGFQLVGDCNLINCRAYNNDKKGIRHRYGVDGSTIQACKCIDNGDDGILMQQPTGAVKAIGNTCKGNGADGIHFYEVDYGIIASNEISGNTANGIYYQGGTNAIIEGNSSVTSLRGVYVGGVTGGLIRNNILQLSSGIVLGACIGVRDSEGGYVSFIDVYNAAVTYVVNDCNMQNFTGGETCTVQNSPDYPRTLRLWIYDADTSISAFTITVKGIDASGVSISEVFTFAGGLVQNGAKAFSIVSEVKVNLITGNGSGDKLNLGINDKLGVPADLFYTADVYKTLKNDTNIAVPTVDLANNTVDFATITTNDDFAIYYFNRWNQFV